MLMNDLDEIEKRYPDNFAIERFGERQMKDETVAQKIQDAEELLKDIKNDFRTGYVGAARRKAEALSSIALEIMGAINVATAR